MNLHRRGARRLSNPKSRFSITDTQLLLERQQLRILKYMSPFFFDLKFKHEIKIKVKMLNSKRITSVFQIGYSLVLRYLRSVYALFERKNFSIRRYYNGTYLC